MDTQLRLTDEQMAFLEQGITEFIPRHIISNGWEYYRTRKVTDVKGVAGNAIHGIVLGSARYAVLLDADRFEYSNCSCPYDGYCKHMAAVYLQYTAALGSDATAAYARLKQEPALAQAVPLQATAASRQSPSASAAPAQWRAWFAESSGELWKQCRQSLQPLQPALSELKSAARDWPEQRQRLYWLHALVFMLEQAEQAYSATESYSRYYYEMTFMRTVDPWIAQFNELLVMPAKPTVSDAQWLDALLEALRARAIQPDAMLLRWDLLYYTALEACAGEPERLTVQQQALAALLEQTPHVLVKPYAFVQGMLACLEVWAGQDAAAVRRLRSGVAFERVTDFIYAFVERRLADRNWAAFEEWLHFLREELQQGNTSVRSVFLRFCRKAEQLRPDGHYLAWMIEELPYAYAELSAHWLEKGCYMEWADLQLLLSVRPEDLDVQQVQTVAKKVPSALIPLYHQAVDEAMGGRNRQGYRHAVRLLKKLLKLYEASGRKQRGEQYIARLQQQHARLRAFQEELRKGKLNV